MDDYQTIDPKALARLLPFLMRDSINTFAEPCCGKGHLVQALKDVGLRCVLDSDLQEDGVDAFDIDDFCDADAIITNPPWTRAVLHRMIEHFQAHAPCVWLLFDADWANNVQAEPYLDRCSDIVACGRLKWFNDTTGKDNASWYRFDRDHRGGPKFHGRKNMSEPVLDVKPAMLVTEFIKLRDEKQKFEKMCSAKCRELYDDRMEIIENQLLDLLNKLGLESIKGKGGTAFKTISTSVTVADMREFRRHVIGTENWDLADWRANKTTINNMVDNGEALPPGINRTAFAKIQIRRK